MKWLRDLWDMDDFPQFFLCICAAAAIIIIWIAVEVRL